MLKRGVGCEGGPDCEREFLLVIICVRGIVAACEPSKLATRVRFPADAILFFFFFFFSNSIVCLFVCLFVC